MQFFRRDYPAKTKPDSYPACSLNTYPAWNDFGIFSLFGLYYYPDANTEHFIGKVKILKFEVDKTEIPRSFEELDKEFISLGQSTEYYKKLKNICSSEVAEEILLALRDIARNKSLAEDFQPTSAYRNSLFRESSADSAFLHGLDIINENEVTENFSFTYTVNIPNKENPFDVEINFDAQDPVPGRIVGIIGKNAVGKTKFLTLLAED